MDTFAFTFTTVGLESKVNMGRVTGVYCNNLGKNKRDGDKGRWNPYPPLYILKNMKSAHFIYIEINKNKLTQKKVNMDILKRKNEIKVPCRGMEENPC